jgi:hypothetical protein
MAHNRSCDGHHIIIDYREDCDRQHSRETGAVLNCERELPKDWGTTMSTFTNQTSRVAIEARIAERRRADNGNELTTRGDYHRPFGKGEGRAEAAKWLCQV